MSNQDRIRVILVNTSHPGNIGAVARAMANMGVTQLALVDPVTFPDAQASAMAAGADEVLDSAQVFPTLLQAIEGCTQVYGVSARLRSVAWPQYDPRQLSDQIMQSADNEQIGLVFGRERSGLTNEELDLCQALVHIPVDEMHRSLNLAAAVMVILYELKMAAATLGMADSGIGKKHHSDKASAADIQYFFDRWDQTSKQVDFYKGNPDIVMRKIRRVFYKSDLSQEEVKILLGVLSAIDSALPEET